MTQRTSRLPSIRLLLLVQTVFFAAFVLGWVLLPSGDRQRLMAEVTGQAAPVFVPLDQQTPVRVASLYDDPSVITDEELAAVLSKVLPRFDRIRLRPNYVEHALRIWGAEIEFDHPSLISGPEMVRFLTDSGSYVESWKDEAPPILLPQDNGVSIRWGPDRTASVHHDHLITCLTEAGVSLDTPVYLPGRTMHVKDVLREAVADFRLDEREVEWSVMAFGFWLSPNHVTNWQNSDARRITFDLLASRLMRNHKRHGVCLGTHRVYSLVVLLRLNEEFGGKLITPATVAEISQYLTDVQRLISETPDRDGSWPPNWTDGSLATQKALANEPAYRTVISTGHHLEWLALAPQEFHPSRDRIREAADWAIANTIETSQDVIDENYTYYSHVGNALALWRGTTPPEFWQRWRETHPGCEDLPEAASEVSGLDSSDPRGDHE